MVTTTYINASNDWRVLGETQSLLEVITLREYHSYGIPLCVVVTTRSCSPVIVVLSVLCKIAWALAGTNGTIRRPKNSNRATCNNYHTRILPKD